MYNPTTLWRMPQYSPGKTTCGTKPPSTCRGYPAASLSLWHLEHPLLILTCQVRHMKYVAAVQLCEMEHTTR